MYKFLRGSLIIIVTVMLTTFRPICPSAFFRCFMSNQDPT